uniref:Si:dkeyp-57d7.4 n=2 Tax=Astyanax mexicanus TaxID=7994 RepID=A0A3B1IXF1_ASTMX
MWGGLDRFSTSPLADHARTISDRILFFPRFASKTEFLSYMLLFVVKMPFPPATRPRILSGEDAEKKSLCPAGDKKSSVNYRLKQLGKKATQYKSKLPTSCATAGSRPKGKSAWITTPQPDDSSSYFTNASGIYSLGNSSGKSVTTTNSSRGTSLKTSRTPTRTSATFSTDSRSPKASLGSSGSGNGNGEAVSFSLCLTPEAVLLLQRRSYERQLRAARGSSGKAANHQKELSGKCGTRTNIPLVKVSLLNDHHRYDDMEYEEAVEQVVDQSVLLKCAEWLRGVEKAAGAATLGKAVKSSQKTI